MCRMIDQQPLDEMFEYAEWLERQVALYEFAQTQKEEPNEISEIISENIWNLFEE